MPRFLKNKVPKKTRINQKTKDLKKLINFLFLDFQHRLRIFAKIRFFITKTTTSLTIYKNKNIVVWLPKTYFLVFYVQKELSLMLNSNNLTIKNKLKFKNIYLYFTHFLCFLQEYILNYNIPKKKLVFVRYKEDIISWLFLVLKQLFNYYRPAKKIMLYSLFFVDCGFTYKIVSRNTRKNTAKEIKNIQILYTVENNFEKNFIDKYKYTFKTLLFHIYLNRKIIRYRVNVYGVFTNNLEISLFSNSNFHVFDEKTYKYSRAIEYAMLMLDKCCISEETMYFNNFDLAQIKLTLTI